MQNSFTFLQANLETKNQLKLHFKAPYWNKLKI